MGSGTERGCDVSAVLDCETTMYRRIATMLYKRTGDAEPIWEEMCRTRRSLSAFHNGLIPGDVAHAEACRVA